MEIHLDFLEEGKYQAQIYRDGENVDFETVFYDIKIENRDLDRSQTLQFELDRSGGVAIPFRKQ